MTKDDYRATLAVLGLSQVDAAKLLGIADRTSRAYALGERPVPEPVALALRLLIEKQHRKRRVRRRQQMQWRRTPPADAHHDRCRADAGVSDPVRGAAANAKPSEK